MLNIYFHRKYSGFIAAASAVLVVSGGIGLARAGSTFPLVVQLVGWLVIAAMVWGIIVGLRQMWRPPLMYSADRRGVMIYYNSDRGIYNGNGVFLPWSLVTGMSLEERTAVGGTSKMLRTWVIACVLQGDAPFPVKEHSVGYSPKDGERVVCLDAFTGNVAGQAMLDRLSAYVPPARQETL